MNRTDPASDLMALLELGGESRELIEIALSHPSYVNEGLSSSRESNQRLEFLGDSVLSLVIAERLYRDNPGLQEGHLTLRRAVVVREEALAEAALQIGLSDYLLMGKGADESGDRYRPSVLADAVEALIGAVYLGGGLQKARDFVFRWLRSAVPGDSQSPKDSKSKLQELLARAPGRRVEYVVTGERGPDHNKVFSVTLYIDRERVATGDGKSKKQAEQEAARNAFSALCPSAVSGTQGTPQ